LVEVDDPMAVKWLVLILTFFCLLGLRAGAIGLDMSITENVEGYSAWFSIDNGPVQRFQVRWENIGTVNCLVRPRIDIFHVQENGTGGLVYTAWGSEEPVLSGASREWSLYSDLVQGNYSAELRMYFCNEITENHLTSFSVAPDQEEGLVSIEQLVVQERYIDVTVRSGDYSGDVVVLPVEYPFGWIFVSSNETQVSSGRPSLARLSFVPVKREGVVVKIRAVSVDGRVAGEREFSVSVPDKVPVQEGLGLLVLAVIMIVAIITVIYVASRIIKIWKG
jgi:hypothetical protein